MPSSPPPAPGAWRALEDHWGPFPTLARRFPDPAVVVIDRRVEALHPRVAGEVARRARTVVRLRAGERAKSVGSLDPLVRAGLDLPRSGAVVCIGGGTLGDLATVAAHLLKRGVRLIHVPSTLLAAVDSSVGGKGALHSGGGRPVKNALGVFHYPEECWICPELFRTLAPRQLREGALEAWKMAACLSEPLWRAWRRRTPALPSLIREARALKARVCEEDPYEQEGLRRVLNFGHTFGHVIESVSGFKVSHGDAVGLGMLCALDVGRRLGITPEPLAEEVEAGLREGPGVLGRRALARVLVPSRPTEVEALLAADKKAGRAGELRMVLLRALGEAPVVSVDREVWRELWALWRAGSRP